MPNNVKPRPDKRQERERERGKDKKTTSLSASKTKMHSNISGERETTRSVVDECNCSAYRGIRSPLIPNHVTGIQTL